MSKNIDKNDIGVTFRLTIKDAGDESIINVSAASTKYIIFMKPDGVK